MGEVRVFYDFIAGNEGNPIFSDIYEGIPTSSETIKSFLYGLDESAGDMRVAVPGACFDFFEFFWNNDCLELEGPEGDEICNLQFQPSRLEAVAANPEAASFLLLDNSPMPYGEVRLKGVNYRTYAPVVIFPPGSIFDEDLVRREILAGFVRKEEARVFSDVNSADVPVSRFVREQIRSKIILTLRRAGVAVDWRSYTNVTGGDGNPLDEDSFAPDAAVFSIRKGGRSRQDLEKIIDRARLRLPFPVLYDVSRAKRGHLRVSILPVHSFL